MKKKNYLTLDDEFITFCEINNIEDIEQLAKEIFTKGFTLYKYGESPSTPIIEGKTKSNIKKTKYTKTKASPPPPPPSKPTSTTPPKAEPDLYME
jgi:hypothetical protein